MLARYAELAERADYAMRNARVVARRAYSALLDGEPEVPDLPDVLAELACAVGPAHGRAHPGGRSRAGPRSAVVDVVVHAKVMSDDAVALLGTSEQVLVAQLRSIALDLLQATGLSRAEARAAMHAP